LSNAVKYNREGGSVSVKTEQINEDRLRISVSDTGKGIPQEEIAKLFDPFERLSHIDGSVQGTGIGLTVTKKLVEAMSGTIGVECVLGEGSTFWIELPRATKSEQQDNLASDTAESKETKDKQLADTAQPEDLEALLRSQYAGRRILVAEDNEINVKLAELVLTDVSLEVDVAENGRVAVDKAGANHYDLILMDVQMPEMDGLEATRVIRSIEGKADLPILAMTASAFEKDRQACMEAGMNDFISKPFDRTDLFSKIIKWLSKSVDSKK